MSLAAEPEWARVLEHTGEYKEFHISVSVTKGRHLQEYIRFSDKQHRVPEYQIVLGSMTEDYENCEAGTSKVLTDSTPGCGLGVYREICGHYGYDISDLEGLANAANKLLDELRQSTVYNGRLPQTDIPV